jgi:hypothetical protein
MHLNHPPARSFIFSVKYFHSVQPINETREAIKEKIMTEKQMIDKENITEEESEVL